MITKFAVVLVATEFSKIISKFVFYIHFSDSMEAVKLTHEQMRIVKYKPKQDEVIKIVAFAGKISGMLSLSINR